MRQLSNKRHNILISSLDVCYIPQNSVDYKWFLYQHTQPENFRPTISITQIRSWHPPTLSRHSSHLIGRPKNFAFQTLSISPIWSSRHLLYISRHAAYTPPLISLSLTTFLSNHIPHILVMFTLWDKHIIILFYHERREKRAGGQPWSWLATTRQRSRQPCSWTRCLSSGKEGVCIQVARMAGSLSSRMDILIHGCRHYSRKFRSQHKQCSWKGQIRWRFCTNW